MATVDLVSSMTDGESVSVVPNSPEVNSQVRRSPQKNATEVDSQVRRSPRKNATEVDSQVRRSPRKRKGPSQPSKPSTTSIPKKSRRLTSPAWKIFERVEIDGVIFGICFKCQEKIKAPVNNGTTSLLKHMNKHCPKRGGQVSLDQKFLSASQNMDGKVKIGAFTFDQEKSRKDLASAIVMHEYPLSIVEHVGFRKLIHGLQPLFNMPSSRNTIKSDILKLYGVEKTKTYMMFEALPSRVAITTDLWTSRQRKGYMAITAHFIDESWRLQNMIIGFIYVPSPHTKDVLVKVLMDCLMDWNLDKKISSITVDNCSTNDAMINVVEDIFTLNDSLLLDGKLIHMRCSAHVLNLIVKAGLEVIEIAIETVRGCVAYWSATQSRVEKFEDAARKMKIPCTKKLALDCKTRWNSTYLMLETALCYKDVFPRLKLRDAKSASLPSENDWSMAKEICARLKLFHTVTEEFSKTQSPTSNSLFPKIIEIRLALRSWCNSPNATIKAMALDMIQKFDSYWCDCSLIAGIAIVLDPRYKKKFLEIAFCKLFGEDGKKAQVDRVIDACYALLSEYHTRASISEDVNVNSDSPNGIPSAATSVEHVGEQMDIFQEFDLIVGGESSKTTSVKAELDHYLEENVFPRSNDFDVLSWWKGNGVRYPTLQLIARDILAIPASTVASESAFSTSGRVVSPHRSRLGAEILEALMCTRGWLWNNTEENTSMAEAELTSTTNIFDEERPELLE